MIPAIFILHPLLDIDSHSADGIDNPAKTVQIHLDIIIHRDTEKTLGCLSGQRFFANQISMVDLVPAQAFDPHPGIAGNRDNRGFARLRVNRHHQQGVGAAGVVFPRSVIHTHDQDIQFVRRHNEMFRLLRPFDDHAWRCYFTATKPPVRQYSCRNQKKRQQAECDPQVPAAAFAFFV